MIDGIGWVATAMFLASYACKDPKRLRLTQAAAALLWVAYGALLHAIPIVVANLLLVVVAVYSALGGSLLRRNASSGPAITGGDEPGLSRIS
jgi:Bacterial inner membrane protein